MMSKLTMAMDLFPFPTVLLFDQLSWCPLLQVILTFTAAPRNVLLKKQKYITLLTISCNIHIIRKHLVPTTWVPTDAQQCDKTAPGYNQMGPIHVNSYSKRLRLDLF